MATTLEGDYEEHLDCTSQETLPCSNWFFTVERISESAKFNQTLSEEKENKI